MLQVVCIATGIFIGIVLVRTVLGLGGIVGGTSDSFFALINQVKS